MIRSKGERKVTTTTIASDRDFSTQQKKFDKIVEEHKDIFSSPTRVSLHYQVNHSIDLDPSAPLPNAPIHRCSLMEKEKIKHQIHDLIQKGHIWPRSSLCGSPIVLIQNKDGMWRLYIDYRALNKIIVKNQYPIPQINDLLDQLRGAKYFIKIDLKLGYH